MAHLLVFLADKKLSAGSLLLLSSSGSASSGKPAIWMTSTKTLALNFQTYFFYGPPFSVQI